MKRKKEKSDNFWDKLINIMYFVFGGLILVLCFIILFSTTGHCANEEPIAYELPYNFYVFDANNTLCLQYNEDIIQSAINWNSDIANYNWNNYIAYPIEISWGSYGEVQIKYLFNPTIEYDVPSDINYFNTGITITYDNTVVFDVLFEDPNNQPFYFSSWGSGGSGSINVCGSFLPYDTGKGSIQRYYPFYSSNDIYDINGDLIFGYVTNPVINTGSASVPLPFIYPEYLTGQTPPTNVPPTYTVNNYSWSIYIPPTVDNSSVQNLLESLTDIVKYNANYLKDNLHNEFSNLINNIKGLIDYIGQTIQYYGNLIIETIQNLITTFYNNMVSIGEDITNKLTYIVSPLDSSAVTSAFQDTGIYNDYDAIFDMVQDAFGFYNDISEPTSFTIPIDLRSVTILHQRQIIYIDLGWLNSCKTIIRAFMWCVLTFGLLYTIIDSIPDYLQGNDE